MGDVETEEVEKMDEDQQEEGVGKTDMENRERSDTEVQIQQDVDEEHEEVRDNQSDDPEPSKDGEDYETGYKTGTSEGPFDNTDPARSQEDDEAVDEPKVAEAEEEEEMRREK